MAVIRSTARRWTLCFGMLGDKQVAKQNELVEWTREGLEVAGFEGFQRLAGLSPDHVPQAGGVYVFSDRPESSRSSCQKVLPATSKAETLLRRRINSKVHGSMEPRFSTSVRPAVERMDVGGCGSGWMSTAGTVEVSQMDIGAAATSGSSATVRTCSWPGRRPPAKTRRTLSQD